MTTATIGGFPILGSSPAHWEIKAGPRPYIGEFDLIPDHARQLLAVSANVRRPVELFIDSGSAPPLRCKNLWVLNVHPGDNPYIMKVVVADVRWFWPYAHVIRRYNMHRHASVQRVLSHGRLELDPVVPRVQYWRWSVHTNGNKYNTVEIVKDVIKEASSKVFTGPPSTTIEQGLGDKINNIPAEQFVVDEPGDQAVMRVMAFMPEGKIYPNADGNIVIDSKATGKEAAVISALYPEQVGKGHVEIVDNRLVRPSAIEVLFTREVELRFDFSESTRAAGETVTEEDVSDRREMENVLPLPDFQWPIDGRVECQGTYVTFNGCFRSWDDLVNPFNPAEKMHIDHPEVQKAFMPFNDMWAVLGLVGKTDVRADWISRIAAIQEHYRRTFRIKSRWMDRILSIRPYRVSTIEKISGQRAPAMAYCDYAILNSTRTIWRDHSGGNKLTYYINRSGYPTNGVIDENATPSPMRVTIPDSDQGIIHIDYIMDPFRVFEMALPSNVTGDVHGDLTNRNDTIAFDAIVDVSKPLPRLSPNFKCAIIVSVIPASPNSINQLHKVTVKPEDLEGLLPSDAALANANGPVMQVRIGAAFETARIRWMDEYAGEIEKMFGAGVLNEPASEPVQVEDGGAILPFSIDSLCLNLGEPKDTISASLTNIAKAVACRVYASLIDRYQGQRTGNLNASAYPLGWADSILHSVSTKGECTTMVTLPEKVEQFNLMSFLDSSSRSVLLKLVQP